MGSSAILVVISIDRYLSISQPLSTINRSRQRQKARLMVLGSWVFTLICSSPQAIIWRVLKHPTKEFYQCTTIDFFEDLAEEHLDPNTNKTEYFLAGINTEAWHTIYHTVVTSQIF